MEEKNYYKFKITLNESQRIELLEVAKTISFQNLYNEGNFFSTDMDQVQSRIPHWLLNLFDFPYRRIIFLYNRGNVQPHVDNGRTSVITFPLNKTNACISWRTKDLEIVDSLYYGTDPYLINVSKCHSVDVQNVDRYFLQLPLNGSWLENVEYFRKKGLIF